MASAAEMVLDRRPAVSTAPFWKVCALLLPLLIGIFLFPGALIGFGPAYFLGFDPVASALAGGAIGAGLMLMWLLLR